MRTIPRDIVENLTFALNKLSLASQNSIRRMLANLTFSDIASLREQLLTMLEPFFGAATDDAAFYASYMYDEIREYSVGKRLGAISNSMRDSQATEGAIRAFVGYLDEKGIEYIIQKLCERIDYEIKKAAADCVSYNANRDPLNPKYARVPTGDDTCDFCLMLASRGFVYSSAKEAGALDHWHANCDCRVVPGFEGSTSVAGYDPIALYKKWKESGFNPNN